MLQREQTLLLVVDIQERLLPAIPRAGEIEKNTVKLLKIAQLLEMPILITEQYSNGLGPTCPSLLAALGETKPRVLEKMSFSAYKNTEIKKILEPYPSVVLCGIECHVCVCQTALDLRAAEKEVHVIAECTGSRKEENYRLGLERMRQANIVLSSVEMAAFELMQTAFFKNFKAVLDLIK